MAKARKKPKPAPKKEELDPEEMPTLEPISEAEEVTEAEPLPEADALPLAEPLPEGQAAIPDVGPLPDDDEEDFAEGILLDEAAAPEATSEAPKEQEASEALEEKQEAAPAAPAAPAPPAARPPVSAALEPEAAPADEQEACIAVMDPEGNETVFALDRAVLSFGRDEENDICIADKKCSRKHFVIEAAGDYFNAIDLGSTNGLKIKGRKVRQRRLRDGDEIKLGAFTITYHGPTDESEPDELAGESEAAAPEAPEDQGAPTEEQEAPGEDGASEEAEAAPDGPEPLDDTLTCPECEAEMPENAPCGECGYKSLQLRAQEYYVDHVARNDSLLGGLGLWKLKRQKVLEQCFEQPKIKWVLEGRCAHCGHAYREMNEFRVRFIHCEECDAEVKLPETRPPKIP